MVLIVTCGLLTLGWTWLKAVKFDTSISVVVTKGPAKGLSLKLIDYQVSYNDIHTKNSFWESHLGRTVFAELSSTLQMIIMMSKKYVDVRFDVNYAGLIRRHYKVVEHQGIFELEAV